VTEAQALAAVSDDIQKLRDKVMWLQALVHETDLSSRLDGSRFVRVLACQIREVTFEAEDAIDLFYLQADLSRRFGRSWTRAALQFVLNIRTQLCVRFTLSRCIQSLNVRLQEILDNSTKYSSGGSKGDSSGKQWRACRAIPTMRHGWDEEYMEPFELRVRYDEKKKLVNKLRSVTSVVIPVVGVGGVGKRALLRHACESEDFEYFDVRIPVRFPLDVDESSIVTHVKETLDKECSLSKQQAKMDVRYLVVIESPVNTTTWSKLKPRLTNDIAGRKAAGIKILVPVTSSPEGVKDTSIKMTDLVERESKVFFKAVYGLNDRYQSEEIDNIHDQIMEITGGHPLAVVLLAKLMRTMDLSKFNAAAEYMVSSNEDSKVQTVLSVCVDDLPDELKSCLLFTAGFPVGQNIDAQQLVRLWMAEGFLTQHHELETERLGQCYLKELIYRGLLQLVSKTSSMHGEGGGHVEWVAIHDQIHLLLRSEAQRTSFMDIHYGGCIPAPGNTRRLALHKYNHRFDALRSGLGKLRTVMSYSSGGHRRGFSNSEDEKQSTGAHRMHNLLKGSPYLRVINLEGIDVGVKLPKCIGEMVHLQYLGVRSQTLEKVPSSIGNLRELQTIDVRDTKVRELPNRLWTIKKLRHVLGDRLAFPGSTGKDDLKLLQTLETVTIKPVPVPVPVTTTKKGEESRPRLGSLHRLHVVELDDSHKVALSTILMDLGSLNSLGLSSLQGTAIPINNLFSGALAGPCHLGSVESLELDGQMMMPQHTSEDDHYCCTCCDLISSRILNRLTHLVLRSTNINQEFITQVISKLPALDKLVLNEGSYVGGELDLCAQKFRSLTTLEISGLPTLKKIFVPNDQVKVMKPYHVKHEAHKPCSVCQNAAASSATVPNESMEDEGGHLGDGGSSNATTIEEDSQQSPVPSIREMILAAIDRNESTKTGIKDYIEKKYGGIVYPHLEHMVQSGTLNVTRGRYNKYSLARPKAGKPLNPTGPREAAATTATPTTTNGDGGSSSNQSPPPPPITEMILEAINNNESSKTGIKDYIQRTYGDVVQKHLEHMVKSKTLMVNHGRRYHTYIYTPGVLSNLACSSILFLDSCSIQNRQCVKHYCRNYF